MKTILPSGLEHQHGVLAFVGAAGRFVSVERGKAAGVRVAVASARHAQHLGAVVGSVRSESFQAAGQCVQL